MTCEVIQQERIGWSQLKLNLSYRSAEGTRIGASDCQYLTAAKSASKREMDSQNFPEGGGSSPTFSHVVWTTHINKSADHLWVLGFFECFPLPNLGAYGPCTYGEWPPGFCKCTYGHLEPLSPLSCTFKVIGGFTDGITGMKTDYRSHDKNHPRWRSIGRW